MDEAPDVLSANMVFAGLSLLGNEVQRIEFINRAGGDVVIDTISDLSIPAPFSAERPRESKELRMMLDKGQVAIIVNQNRTTIERRYPERDDLSRLADIIDMVRECCQPVSPTLTAVGVNIVWLYHRSSDKQPSGAFLAENIFASRWGNLNGLPLVGEAARLRYVSGNTSWTFRVEPRALDVTGRRVYLSLNQHQDRSALPKKGETWQLLQEAWNKMSDFGELIQTKPTEFL